MKKCRGIIEKKIWCLLLLLFGVFFSCNIAGAAEKQNNQVLFISSYSYDWSSIPKQLSGVRKEFGNIADVDYIFMNAKNREEETASKDLIRILREYALADGGKLKYDLVMIGDDPALDVCLEYREEFFDGLPIVFLGINDVEKAKQVAKEPLITGVAEQMPFKETIDLAKSLYPDATEIVAISNSTSTGRGSLEQFYACEKDFPELDFQDIDTLEYSVGEIQDMVSKYDTKTILLCLMFDRDKTGEKFQMEQGVSWLYDVAKIPIFRADELAIESGSIGGCVISYENMGQKAAKMAKKILKGTNPEDIKVTQMPSFYEMNWKVMEKFQISKKQLPKKKVRYLEYTPTFLESNYRWIWFFFVVVVIAGVIIGILLRENRKRQRLNKKLVETSQSLNAAIEIANLVFFEYFPEQHCVSLLSKSDPLQKKGELFDHPNNWLKMHITHPDDEEEYRRLFEKINDGAAYAEAEIRNKCDGAYHWFQYRMKSIYDSLGNRIKVVGARMDITLTKEIEAGYQHHLNALFSANPNTLASCRLNLTQNKISKLYTVQPGKMRDIMCADSSIDGLFKRMGEDISSEAEREKFLRKFSVRNLSEEFKKGNNPISMSYRCTIDDEMHWVSSLVEMVIEPRHGEIDAVYHAVDITYNRVLELLLESAASHDYDSLSFVFGKTQRFASYSWLYPKEMIIQENFSQVLQDDLDRIKIEKKEKVKEKLAWDVIIENLNTYGEYTVFMTQYHGEGSRRRKKLQFFYIDENEKLILASQRDITDIYENEAKQKEALAVALQEANAANAAKTDFLSRMSHDMRTPMNAIIGITALALDETTDPEAVTTNLTKINSASHFLLSLINDILDMTKIEDGAIELHNEPYYYEDFIGTLRTMFEPLCKENGIQLIFECSEEGNPVVVGDKMRINQVFFNVLSNAVKFTPEGGKVIYREENIEIRGNRLCGDYSIIDTGVGMSKEFQEKMFQPFVQEDSEITSNIQGTGLGLSITKSLMDLMGGTITIESEKGKGTKVTLHFENELAKDQSETIGGKAKGTEIEEDFLKGKRVLLVEDHPLNTEIAKRLLERKGVLVSCAENGERGVNRFVTSTPYFFDAILMDIRMPVMDGLTAAKEIRKLDREDAMSIPIIAMTANAYQEDIQMSGAAGMDAHLAKPIKPEMLYDTLSDKIKNGR